MLPNTKCSFFLLYSVDHKVQDHFHLDKSIVLNRKLDTCNHVMYRIVPLCGVLAILKNKKLAFFTIANPVLSYFQYIFANCFTSKLRKRTDNEKIKHLIRRKMHSAGLELMTPDSKGRCFHHYVMEDFQY